MEKAVVNISGNATRSVPEGTFASRDERCSKLASLSSHLRSDCIIVVFITKKNRPEPVLFLNSDYFFKV
jgi:hypothetical protein